MYEVNGVEHYALCQHCMLAALYDDLSSVDGITVPGKLREEYREAITNGLERLGNIVSVDTISYGEHGPCDCCDAGDIPGTYTEWFVFIKQEDV